MKKAVIELKDVKKTYIMGEVPVHALRGADLKIEKGEFLSIMGASGSGKSTIMNMIGALDVPTTGQIFLDGIDIASLSESDLAVVRGEKIGFVFQKFNLINSLTAAENVALPLLFRGFDAKERFRRADDVLDKVGLDARKTHHPTQLSGGEQQRVAIARALVGDPEVILADEPTGNLDSKTGLEIMKMLTRLHEKEEKTLVVVTHDKNIAHYADRIATLEDGVVTKCTTCK